MAGELHFNTCELLTVSPDTGELVAMEVPGGCIVFFKGHQTFIERAVLSPAIGKDDNIIGWILAVQDQLHTS